MPSTDASKSDRDQRPYYSDEEGQKKKKKKEAEEAEKEGKEQAAGFPMHYSVASRLLLTDLSNFPNAYSRAARLHYPRTTRKLWERSLAHFYPFSVERGMGLGTSLLARSYVMVHMYANVFFDVCKTYFWFCMEGIQTPLTRTPIHNGRHPSHALLLQKDRAYS